MSDFFLKSLGSRLRKMAYKEMLEEKNTRAMVQPIPLQRDGIKVKSEVQHQEEMNYSPDCPMPVSPKPFESQEVLKYNDDFEEEPHKACPNLNSCIKEIVNNLNKEPLELRNQENSVSHSTNEIQEIAKSIKKETEDDRTDDKSKISKPKEEQRSEEEKVNKIRQKLKLCKICKIRFKNLKRHHKIYHTKAALCRKCKNIMYTESGISQHFNKYHAFESRDRVFKWINTSSMPKNDSRLEFQYNWKMKLNR